MVLLVKLKNPNRKLDHTESDSTSAEATSALQSQEEEDGASPLSERPILSNANVDDGALDELSSALQSTQLNSVNSNSTVNPVIKFASVPSSPRPAVDVLIAPAVLGHRWVRTRSNAFVVERPERVRAVSLGVAAVLGRWQWMSEKGQESDDLAIRLATLDMHSSLKRKQPPLTVLQSHATLSLARPSSALAMIHALEEEYLSAAEVGQPSLFASENPLKADAPAHGPIAYSSFLDNLCSQAPSDIPPPPAPRPSRFGVSPIKSEDSTIVECNDRASEVPIHLPQGDLYLCGPREVIKTDYFEHNGSTAPSVQGSKADHDLETPHTPDLLVPGTAADHKQEVEKDMAWLQRGSRGAIEAALGTGCAAVDRVVRASRGGLEEDQPAVRSLNLADLQSSDGAESKTVNGSPALRSFVLVRPPGHHCNATQPSGFCWVNNVAVTAAHAYHQHGIDRVAILDFDLHHGNGTQALAWRINADTVRHDLDREARLKAMRAEQDKKGRRARKSGEEVITPADEGRRGLKIFYGSLHDIESFPCEDGNKELVTDASMCIEGAHGQWIWNVHLEAHRSEEDSQRLYREKYAVLLQKARNFFAQTASISDKSLVLLSAGFDACLHEHVGMQRHGKSVPPSFYEAFTRDSVALAEEMCAGKCISILEGGYSDRALTSGAISHLIGLGVPGLGEDIYQVSSLYQLEKVAKAAQTGSQPRRKNDALTKESAWLEYVLEAFRRLEEVFGRKRIPSASNAGGTAPVTPTRAMMDQLWKSPREMRSGRGGIVSAGVSPAK